MSFLKSDSDHLLAPNTMAGLGVFLSICVIGIYWSFGYLAALLIITLPLAIYLSVSYSLYFILLFILFSYFRIHEAFPVLMPLKIPKIVALAGLFGIFWHLFITKQVKPFWHRAHTLFVLFFLWTMVSVFFATNRQIALDYWLAILPKAIVMVFAICWWFNTQRIFSIARVGIMLSGVAISMVAIFNKLNGIGLVEGTRVTISRHLESQIGDPNDLSLVLLFPVSFLCAELFNSQHNTARKCLLVVALLCVIYGIVATQSRGGLLGLVAVIGYFLLTRVKNPLVIVSAFTIGLIVLMTVAGISERQSGGAAETGLGESAMGRIYAWQAALSMAFSNPLTGVGLDNFYANYFFHSPFWDGKNHAVHSTWFQVLAETGFVGFALFTLLLIVLYRILQRSERLVKQIEVTGLVTTVHALKGGFLGFLVSGTFLTQAFTWPFYIIFSLSIALERMLLRYREGEARYDTKS